MDAVARRLAEYSWPYADQDSAALKEIAKRVARAGRTENLVTYTELVAGIDFCLSSVNGGQSVRLGVPEWTELHRAIIGDFLGRLCLDTYAAGQFMGSAFVVASETGQPSAGYKEFMRQLGVLHGKGDSEFLGHWIPETRKAYDWYAKHTQGSVAQRMPSA
jgi:hypothetical protein